MQSIGQSKSIAKQLSCKMIICCRRHHAAVMRWSRARKDILLTEITATIAPEGRRFRNCGRVCEVSCCCGIRLFTCKNYWLIRWTASRSQTITTSITLKQTMNWLNLMRHSSCMIYCPAELYGAPGQFTCCLVQLGFCQRRTLEQLR